MNNLLIIGFVWPEPNSTAAGTRMLQLIELFQKKRYNITFACAAAKTQKSFNLNEINVQTAEIQINNSEFNSFIQKINPEIVLFDRYLTEEQFGWKVTENCPTALKILDTEDLHFLRHARHEAYKKNNTISLKYLVNDLTKREIASIYRCDVTLIISKYEMKLLKKTFNINKSLLLYTPFLLDKTNIKSIQKLPSFKHRNHFMTIGNFKHEPNWNAILYLKKEIWPLIREKLPTVEMHIYGAYASEKVEQLHNVKDGFLIKGWAEDTEEVFKNSRVCLAPLQFGAGLKGKLIDAMTYGTPSITTTVGAEAMHKNLPWNGFICDKPKLFASKAIELYSNQRIWKEAQINGVEIINSCFSKIKYEIKFIERIDYLKQNKSRHRLHNFIGSMLTHHTLRSTKFMSKWIEEKNKNMK